MYERVVVTRPRTRCLRCCRDDRGHIAVPRYFTIDSGAMALPGLRAGHIDVTTRPTRPTAQRNRLRSGHYDDGYSEHNKSRIAASDCPVMLNCDASVLTPERKSSIAVLSPRLGRPVDINCQRVFSHSRNGNCCLKTARIIGSIAVSLHMQHANLSTLRSTSIVAMDLENACFSILSPVLHLDQRESV